MDPGCRKALRFGGMAAAFPIHVHAHALARRPQTRPRSVHRCLRIPGATERPETGPRGPDCPGVCVISSPAQRLYDQRELDRRFYRELRRRLRTWPRGGNASVLDLRAAKPNALAGLGPDGFRSPMPVCSIALECSGFPCVVAEHLRRSLGHASSGRQLRWSAW
jgi:hypothetical protein